MRQQPGLFDVDARLKELSAEGDALEGLSKLLDFEKLDGSKGNRSCE